MNIELGEIEYRRMGRKEKGDKKIKV